MMIILREITAVIIFLVAIYFIVGLFSSGFNWLYLAGCMACFLLAYLTWPSKKQGQRSNDNWLLDCLEVIIELPTEFLIWILRSLTRLIPGKGDGFDINL